MYTPLRGCCTDSPGLDDIVVVRKTYLALAALFGAASLAVGIFHIFYH
ncbi:hypothetical protein [Rhizomicrobium electricum]|jgi:hypothetical protein|uniref:Uncharacterized protein n=1 Tax=Rhizomicrobium electricum TaxID=480070 RepID=A0ABN1EVW0_9PROT|nr:hypothetical protein [Rhizomicrobium electricum]NIJ50063.1 hypothetical protein [Rhizomicrobium electricum]